MRRQRTRRTLLLISLLLFPVTFYYLSSYLIIQGAAEKVVSGSFIIFTLLFVGALLFGRSWCGWICPAAGLHDATFLAGRRRVRGGDWVKYAIWLPWLALIALVAVKAGGFRRIDPLYQTWQGISLASPQALVIFSAAVGLAVALAFAVGRRSFCHHVCWMAPFMVLGRKIRNLGGWPSLRLQAEGDRCRACGRCSQACPMSLDVQAMVAANRLERAECILCGTCVDTCPERVVGFTWHTAVSRAETQRPKAAEKGDGKAH